MSIFPTIYPDSISYTFGQPQVSEFNAFGLGPVRFRHSKIIDSLVFTFEFRNLQQADIDSIRDHYANSSGTAGTFQVPSAIFGGVGVTTAAAEFKYIETPSEEHFGVYNNVTVVIQDMTGVDPTFILDAGDATLPAEAAFTSFVFNGTAPFILKGTDSATATLILNGD